MYIYISAWASALLVSTTKAMPEPLRVGRVTGKTPTLFLYISQVIFYILTWVSKEKIMLLMTDNIECVLNDILRTMKPHEILGKDGEWYNIALIGKSFKEKGVKYDGKLKEYLSQLESLELFTDTKKIVPVTYLRIKEKYTHTGESKNRRVELKDGKQELLKWAYMGKLSDVLEQLKDKALKEEWNFDKQENSGLPILYNYLCYTFLRIKKEEKICYTKDMQRAIFNTGLVDNKYIPIYALFSKNKNKIRNEWAFNSFIAEGEKSQIGKISIVDFETKPKRAQYFDNPADLLYVVSETSNELMPNYEHIIEDNVDRLPIALLKELVSDKIEAPQSKEEFDSTGEFESYYNKYKEDLKEKIKQKNNARKLVERFRSAIDVARNKVQWNYKTAIPIYYPKRDKISLLLPLCLVNYDVVDLALVVSKGSGGYLAETIYPLDWAYKCARLICRPDSDWLNLNANSKVQNSKCQDEDAN